MELDRQKRTVVWVIGIPMITYEDASDCVLLRARNASLTVPLALPE